MLLFHARTAYYDRDDAVRLWTLQDALMHIFLGGEKVETFVIAWGSHTEHFSIVAAEAEVERLRMKGEEQWRQRVEGASTSG